MHVDIVWLLLIGLIAGWLAGQLMKGGGYGVVGDIVVGILGSFIGGYIFRALGLSASGVLGTIIVATIGAMVLVFLLRALRRA